MAQFSTDWSYSKLRVEAGLSSLKWKHPWSSIEATETSIA